MPNQSTPDAYQSLDSTELRHVSLAALKAEARAQERNYASGIPHFDQPALELFRRAVAEHDNEAWSIVVELYRPLLFAQSGRLLIRGLAREDDRSCVDRAFERFWRVTRATGLAQFPDLASILEYLKMCLASVLLDEARARTWQPAQTSASQLWSEVEGVLETEQERVVARLSFVSGLTPRQIHARHADRFADTRDVDRIKHNIVERLRHRAATRALHA
jgi:hypothetical protein